MSGIYIPNMEMPKACYESLDERRRHPCPFLFLCRQRATFSEPDHDDIKASDCPLVEVPAHGVLKDIDVLNDAIIEAVRLGEITGGEAGFFKAILNNAPRVIDTSKH